MMSTVQHVVYIWAYGPMQGVIYSMLLLSRRIFHTNDYCCCDGYFPLFSPTTLVDTDSSLITHHYYSSLTHQLSLSLHTFTHQSQFTIPSRHPFRFDCATKTLRPLSIPRCLTTSLPHPLTHSLSHYPSLL
jgi:hypothetical protein